MKNIIIAGAGGCGREILQWILDINEVNPTWNIRGFIADDIETAFENISCDTPILDTIINYTPLEDDWFICAIGSPAGKDLVVNKLRKKGAKFASIIHPKAVIANDCEIGEGFIAYPYSVVCSGAKLGSFVTLLSSSVGSCAQIGDYSSISSYCHVLDGAYLGSHTQLSSHVIVDKNIVLGENVFAGAASVILSNAPDNSRLYGNPAAMMNL
ncbi:MAG: sugar O-acyltransferase [Oscillospiraceae bacterium]